MPRIRRDHARPAPGAPPCHWNRSEIRTQGSTPLDLVLDATAEKVQDPGPEGDLPDVRHDQPAVTRPGDLWLLGPSGVPPTACWPATRVILLRSPR
jgi:hypothetical protein